MKVEELLRSNGIRVTKPRIEILNILMNNNEALTAEEIHESCNKNEVDIDFSTVYRVLAVFEDKGIVDKFSLNGERCLFNFKQEQHKHYLECDICHKEVEIDCPMKQIEQLVKVNNGFILTEHDLKMKGICEECR
ncbi:MAG: Fur family transcriptional regulator [Clostridium sp.]